MTAPPKVLAAFAVAELDTLLMSFWAEFNTGNQDALSAALECGTLREQAINAYALVHGLVIKDPRFVVPHARAYLTDHLTELDDLERGTWT